MPSSSSSRSCPRRNCPPPSAPPRTVGGPVVSAHPDIHPDLEAEQAYIVAAYDHLAAMQGRTSVVFEKALDDARRGDVNADAQAMHLGKRLAQLDVGGLALCFGRIDEEGLDTFYVGRRHVETPRGDPVVVDWRAPVSVPFYRATVQDPFGLKRRRRFSIEGHHLLDILDEVFDDPDSMLSGMAGGIADPLLAELERARTGEMRDIVATIQAEQDVVVRARSRRLPRRAGRPRDGEDRGRPAPRRVPHVRAPRGAHRLAGARDRPEPRLPPLHLAGAAVARRDVGRPDDRAGAARSVVPGAGRRARRGRAR